MDTRHFASWRLRVRQCRLADSAGEAETTACKKKKFGFSPSGKDRSESHHHPKVGKTEHFRPKPLCFSTRRPTTDQTIPLVTFLPTPPPTATASCRPAAARSADVKAVHGGWSAGAERERRIIGVQSRNLCGVDRERACVMKTTCGANLMYRARRGKAGRDCRIPRRQPPRTPRAERRLITRWLFRRGKRRGTCSPAYPTLTSG